MDRFVAQSLSLSPDGACILDVPGIRFFTRARSRQLVLLLLKRLVDVLASATILLLIAPFLALIALAIKLDSRGPVFFIHKRPGRRGYPFPIFKFRTMRLRAEDDYQALSPAERREFVTFGKISSDPRVTRVGHWLRRYSLDELPQLINVLLGDMSLVGPRPYMRIQVPQMGLYRDVIFLARPGLTGFWQVNGRSEIPYEQRLRMDAWYVRNWSPTLDLRILLSTPKAMLTGRGAF